jgi:hypothetical protein
MTRTIEASSLTLEQSLQAYRRLTRVPLSQRTRRNYLTARENERSALPLLREGVAHCPIVEYLMTRIMADQPVSVAEMATDGYLYKSLSSEMSRLLRLIKRYEMVWLVRTGHPVKPGGLEFRYRLTPLGEAIMRVKVDEP